MNGHRRESVVVTVLRAVTLVAATLAVTYGLTGPLGMLSAALGAALAALAGGRLARLPPRLPFVWILGIAGSAFALLFRSFVVDRSWAPAIFGIHGTFVATDVVTYGLLAFFVVSVLRISASRVAFFSLLELGAVAIAFASTVAAHRNGAINQPRVLSDWAWTRSIDPTHVLLAIGAAAFVALFFASLREERGRSARVLVHGFAAFLMSALLLLILLRSGAPHPREPEGLVGSKGKGSPKESKGGGGGGGGGQAQNKEQKLEFRDDYATSDEERPVAIVVFQDDYQPAHGYYYFRQNAFSQYSGTRLVSPTMDGMDDDVLSEFPRQATAIANAPAVTDRRHRVRTQVSLMAEHSSPFGLDAPSEITPRASPDPSRFLRAYDVVSAAPIPTTALLGRAAGFSRWSSGVRAEYLMTPSDPRYKSLADDIVTKTLKEEYRQDPFAEATAIASWMGKNATYSRKSAHASATDPTADFLFGDKVGYCVHFAHSVALLLRARGIPSRVAAGYAVEEGRRGNGSSLMIEARDAHAWAEVALDGEGWLVVDVAPAHTLDPPPPDADRDLQKNLGEMARGDKSAGKKDAGEAPSRSFAAVPKIALAVAALVLLVLYGIKGWRRVIPHLASPGQVPRVAYRAALDRIAEAGFTRERDETRESFAERLRPFAPAMAPLTTQHLGSAFGSKMLLPSAEVLRLAREAANSARKKAPFWRVALGTLNPLSWIQTR